MEKNQYIEKYTKVFENVMVRPIDKEKLDKFFDTNIKRQFPGKSDVTYNTLERKAIIMGGKILVDTDAVHEIIDDNEGITFYIYENGPHSVATIPAFSHTEPLAGLTEFLMEPISLKEFMGDRFCYNSRVMGNMAILERSIKSGK